MQFPSPTVRALTLTLGILTQAPLATAATPLAINPGGMSSEGGYFLRADGTLWQLGYKSSVAARLLASNVKQISNPGGNGGSAYVLLDDGSVKSLPGLSTPYAVSGTFKAVSGSIGLTTDGSLWDFDRGARVGSDSGFTQIWGTNTLVNFAAKADGSLWAWGLSEFGEFGDGTISRTRLDSPKQVGTGFTEIKSNGNSYFGLKTDGSLWAWGMNNHGELGTGSKRNCNPANKANFCEATAIQIGSGYTQIAVGSNFAMGLKQDGSLWNWGFNDRGQLGTGGNNDYILSPTQHSTGYSRISAALKTSYALRGDGSLWAWGDNTSGYLGINSTDALLGYSPQRVGDGFAEVWANDLQNYLLKTDGSLWSWSGLYKEISPQQYLGSTLAASSSSTVNCVFTAQEKAYSAYLPGAASTQNVAQYTFRQYQNNAFLAYRVTDNRLLYLGPLSNQTVFDLGDFADWRARSSGC